MRRKMNPITVKEIVKATGGTLLMGKPGDVITGVKHDSRECGADDLFVAIIGENQDAHKYIDQVLENGCRAVLAFTGRRMAETGGSLRCSCHFGRGYRICYG